MTRQDMNRREQKDQEMFVDSVYEQFQEQKLAMLQDEASLKILADDQGVSAFKIKKDGIASIRINQAYRLFRLSELRYLDTDQWDNLKADVRFMFALPSIKERWDRIQKEYPESFQQFINQKL